MTRLSPVEAPPDEAMMAPLAGDGAPMKRVARNSAWSLGTAILPAIIGIVALPYVIDGLGKEAFGVLSLAWIVLGVFAILDFGASRATTRRVAQLLGQRCPRQIGDVLWAALVINAGIAVLSAIVMTLLAEPLVERVLSVPAELERDATIVFRLLALSIPVLLVAGSLRSALEGAQRFDLTSLVQVPANALNFVWPVVVVAVDGTLVQAVALICLTRVALVPCFAALCRRQFVGWRRPRLNRTEAVALLRFGGWFTVSTVAGPILLNLDRLLVGSLLGVRSVGLYSAPYEMVARLTMLPASLMAALFPALSEMAAGSRAALTDVYVRAARLLVVAMMPPCVLIAALAPTLLDAWLGAEFAAEAGNAVRFLALGLFAISLGSLPFNLLHAQGRPEIGAKLHAAELIPYAVVAWALVSRFGITGAAIAWALRAVVDAVLFHVAAARVGGMGAGPPVVGARGIAVLLALSLVMMVGAAALRRTHADAAATVGLILVSGAMYTIQTWYYILDGEDRARLLRLLRRRVRPGRRETIEEA